LTPPENDPEEIKNINHILIIVLIVVVIMILICSGLIFMILQGLQQLAQNKKSSRHSKVNRFEDDDMEFGPVSTRSQKTATKLIGAKMSSGNFEEEEEDSARGVH